MSQYQLHGLFYASSDVQGKVAYADLNCWNGVT